MARSAKVNRKRKGKKLSAEEKRHRRAQRTQRSEVSKILKSVGFYRVPNIDGKHFQYAGRNTEMDDIFILENVILITEYTIGDPKNHLLNKNYFYERLNLDKPAFIEFLLQEKRFGSFAEYYNNCIRGRYSKNQLRVKILYCSKKEVHDDYKKLVDDVVFFDYHIVKYFLSLSKVIKRSSRYEFLDFLGVPIKEFGQNMIASHKEATHTFSGHILPEEKSSFKEGYKIVSFYIDADSLLKRAYVLRRNGWRDEENVGHYQRMLEGRKINSMRKYLAEKERVFINNIIATISSDKVKLYDRDHKLLTINSKGQVLGDWSTEVTPALIEIDDTCNILGLIDGQHRTFAYHEGEDSYENKISEQRKVQNLLVTGILFPSTESDNRRLKFEANLFLEINSTQTTAKSQLTQEIELMVNPFSAIAVAKRVLRRLNIRGPLKGKIEQYWYEKGKLKTSSVVSFGLKPLIKIEDERSRDSIFVLWGNKEKVVLKSKDDQSVDLLDEYIDFAVEVIIELLLAFRLQLGSERWTVYSPGSPNGILTVTFINGVLNVLRLLIENNKVADVESYKTNLAGVAKFNFKQFKSSQYRKMGEQLYKEYFA